MKISFNLNNFRVICTFQIDNRSRKNLRYFTKDFYTNTKTQNKIHL